MRKAAWATSKVSTGMNLAGMLVPLALVSRRSVMGSPAHAPAARGRRGHWQNAPIPNTVTGTGPDLPVASSCPGHARTPRARPPSPRAPGAAARALCRSPQAGAQHAPAGSPVAAPALASHNRRIFRVDHSPSSTSTPRPKSDDEALTGAGLGRFCLWPPPAEIDSRRPDMSDSRRPDMLEERVSCNVACDSRRLKTPSSHFWMSSARRFRRIGSICMAGWG